MKKRQEAAFAKCGMMSGDLHDRFGLTFGAVHASMIRVGLGRLQLAISPLSGIDKAWFNIDVILKQVTMNCRRVKVRNSDMTYERERLASATNARSVYGRSTTVDEKAKAENEIRGPPRSESNRFPPYR
ncbi:MAG TPA: hypothetical protein VFL19_00545 [Nitrospira sp.]|nr:hypothetical protein [Nitrospira sp.]